jgi:hypothetical protein
MTSPRLPIKAPPCFDSQTLWETYRVGAMLTPSRSHEGLTYCTDCTPEHKAKMERQGRCKYPGTVFVMNGDTRVGLRRRTIQ